MIPQVLIILLIFQSLKLCTSVGKIIIYENNYIKYIGMQEC